VFVILLKIEQLNNSIIFNAGILQAVDENQE
jgi:hypothetical protein